MDLMSGIFKLFLQRQSVVVVVFCFSKDVVH